MCNQCDYPHMLQRSGAGYTPNRLRVLEVSYNELFSDPSEHIRKIDELLDGTLDTEAMAATIDPALYRNRA